ncbi:MAG: hypothetical protein QOI12_646 [Alphaproteobacteria bacterium]|nr:hypothetical protein [Alphaproteobacteria bacterium]
MTGLILSAPHEQERSAQARRFCSEFCGKNDRPKFVLGRNVYVEGIVKSADVEGIIDDYTAEKTFLGLPVFKTAEIPRDAMVVAAAGGRPLTAKRNLEEAGFECLDYFSFHRWSGLPLTEVVFNEGFADDFHAQRSEYEWIYDRLHDQASKDIFSKLVSFRLKYDLALLDGFKPMEDVQYFEDFLKLAPDGETFVDVGGFDGFTSREFIKRCPDYRAVHVFEPEPTNYQLCKAKLLAFDNVHVYQMGLSDAKRRLHLSARGSASKISEHGGTAISVDRLDDVLADRSTFMKMDIEGAEAAAIEGARSTIGRDGPRLAISVYHNAGDFWRIPRQILSIRDDYMVMLRHYTESIYETVMFFCRP